VRQRPGRDGEPRFLNLARATWLREDDGDGITKVFDENPVRSP